MLEIYMLSGENETQKNANGNPIPPNEYAVTLLPYIKEGVLIPQI